MTHLPLSPTPPTPVNSNESPVIPSSLLFKGAQSVQIEHAGQRYQLRITRENKLILTK